MVGHKSYRSGDSVKTQMKRRLSRLQVSGSKTKSFSFEWLLMSGIGGALGGTAISFTAEHDFGWLLGIGILGLTVNLAQSQILGRVIYPANWSGRLITEWTLAGLISWLLASTASRVATLAIALWLMSTINVDYTWVYQYGDFVFWIACVPLGATVLSKWQKRILHRHIDTTRRWTLTSITGWTLAWGLGFGVAYIAPGGALLRGVVGGAVGGIVLGTITGYALAWLLAGWQSNNNNSV